MSLNQQKSLRNRICALSVLVGLGSALSTMADEKALTWYHWYLGKECYKGAYSAGEKEGRRFYQFGGGVGEVLEVANLTDDIAHRTWFLGVGESREKGLRRINMMRYARMFLAADAAGRFMGGKCAGFTGLDDLLMKPLLTGANKAYDWTFGAVPMSADEGYKQLSEAERNAAPVASSVKTNAAE